MKDSIQKNDFSFLVQLLIQVWKKRFQGRLPDPESSTFTSEINLLREELQAYFPNAFRIGVNEGKGFQDNIRAILSNELQINKLPTLKTIEVLSCYLYNYKPENLELWQKTFIAELQNWNRFKKDIVDSFNYTIDSKIEATEIKEDITSQQGQEDDFSSANQIVKIFKKKSNINEYERKIATQRNKYKLLVTTNLLVLAVLSGVFLSNFEYYHWLFFWPYNKPKHKLWVAVYQYKNEHARDTTIYVYNTFRFYRDHPHVKEYFYSDEIGDSDAFYFTSPLLTRSIKESHATTKDFADDYGGPPIVRELQGI